MKNSILIICSLFFCNLSTAMNPDIFVCDREQDSLALVQFYGQLTTLSWDLTQPIDSFEGVTLNAEGCVEKISITSGVAGGNFPNVSLQHIKALRIEGFGSGNCSLIVNLELFNDIPDFCCMPQLEKLTLRMFKAGSPIPNFSNLPKLKHLEIVARAITGPLPDFSNCPELETLVISGYTTTWIFSCLNRRTGINGGIPNYNLPNLNFLTMRINRLNGDLPDFSNMPSTATINVSNNYIENIPALNTNALINVTQNYFTFEDLLPHLDNFSNYAPQHLIPVEPLIRINDNGNPEIDIQFDADVQGSTYIWFKYNVQIGTTTTNRLEIPDPAEVNGLYKVTVTNPGAPALTLMTEDFNVVFCEHFVGA